MNKEKLTKMLSISGLVALSIVALNIFMLSDAAQNRNDAAVALAASRPSTSGSVWEILKARGLQGAHYTLNIHGKKTDFNKSDCTATPDPVTGLYGNSIFVPSNSDPAERNQIVITSGNAKGKWASTNPIYGVRDTCTAPYDGDAAEVTLPPNDKGYYVTARVLGKPTNNPELQLDGSLTWVMDENGNDLLVLGLVTDNGFETPSGTLSRTSGKVKAVDVTGLFEWSGSVCYFSPQNYCYDEANQYTCTDKQLCCQDTNADGIFDSCTEPLLNAEGATYCATGNLTTLGCQDYLNEWVFNIGDFVGYMWDTYTDGDFKLANIRFYPVK